MLQGVTTKCPWYNPFLMKELNCCVMLYSQNFKRKEGPWTSLCLQPWWWTCITVKTERLHKSLLECMHSWSNQFLILMEAPQKHSWRTWSRDLHYNRARWHSCKIPQILLAFCSSIYLILLRSWNSIAGNSMIAMKILLLRFIDCLEEDATCHRSTA